MNIPFHIAKRYLFSKKSTNAINLISGISVVAIAIGAAALLLILTVFNGFEGLISGFFNSFNPPIKVYPAAGKYIDEEAFPWPTLDEMPEIDVYSKTLEALVLFEFNDIQEVGYMKGVDENFTKVTSIDSTIRKGNFIVDDGTRDFTVLGSGLANKLNISVRQSTVPMSVYSPSRSTGFPPKPYTSKFIFPAGTFSVQGEEDYKYAFSSLPFLQSLSGNRNEISYIEIKPNQGVNVQDFKSNLKKALGENYIVKDLHEQDASFLRIMAIEKWLSYAIACFTLLLIAFNMVGALWMIVLDKRKDLSILKAMGMRKNQLERIFLYEGILVSFLGFAIGIIIGLIVYYLQINYGIVPIPPGAIIDAYPAELHYFDIVIVFVTVMVIGLMASILPAKRAGMVDTNIRET